MTIQKQKRPSVYRQAFLMAATAGAVALAATLLTGRVGASSVTVRAGDDLQAAIDNAQPGDEIRLEAGAVFSGAFVLPAKQGGEYITIRTTTEDRRLGAPGRRIGLEHERLMPTLTASSARPILRTEPGARHWRLIGLRFVGNGGNDMITLGDGGPGQNALDRVPEDLILDRLLIVGDPAEGQKRGIALNSGATTIRNSYIADIKDAGVETQAIAGWNGPGPYTIENNYLEAAGMSVLFGGAEPYVPNLVPSDITFRRNTLAKPLAWRGTTLTIKNLFELKNARRVTIEGNVMERNWSAAQVGYAVLFTVRASGSRARWSTVEDVTFQNNIVRGVAGGINILGHDTAFASQQARRIVVRNNLFLDVNDENWGGNGNFLQVGEEPADITVDHNTVIQSGNLITAYGGTRTAPRTIRGFRFTNNIGLHNSFGISGSGQGFGTTAIAAYFPGGEIVANVLAGGPSGRYPGGNIFPPIDELLDQFVNPAREDYRLESSSSLQHAGTDGGPVGVNYIELNRAIGGMGLR